MERNFSNSKMWYRYICIGFAGPRIDDSHWLIQLENDLNSLKSCSSVTTSCDSYILSLDSKGGILFTIYIDYLSSTTVKENLDLHGEGAFNLLYCFPKETIPCPLKLIFASLIKVYVSSSC